MYLFDFDGTLVDSNGVWVEIDNGFLARRGLTPTREYSDTVGHSIFPIAAQFTKDYYCLDMTPEAIMAEWLDMARDAYARQVPMKPGAEAFLARCAAAGEPMALLTACVPELCRAALARHRLEGYFRQIIFVQELGLEKRNPEAFTRSLALPGFRMGDSVQHKAFGRGLITKVTPMGGDALVEIAFDSVGTKKLMLKSASQYMKKV